DLRDVSSAALHYRVWYDFEVDYDFGYLTVSADGGATWDVLAPDFAAGASIYGRAYTGASTVWLNEAVSLDAYAGQEILVRVMVITDDALNSPGMAIDDIRLEAAGYADDFEAGGGGWEARGWIRTDNRLPARLWVQVMQTSPDGPDVQR